MPALALISDLMMQSQVSAAAARSGVEFAAVATVEALLAKIADTPPTLVIVDLSHPALDPRAVFDQMRPLLPVEATTIAFGPHVHKARLAAAAEAGFSQVVSRGQFHAEMQALLARYAQ